MKKPEPVWNGATLSKKEWSAVEAACGTSKWYPILEKLRGDNKPTELSKLDRTVETLSEMSNVAWFKGIPCLNNLLKSSGLPCRIRKVVRGHRIDEGLIQLCRE